MYGMKSTRRSTGITGAPCGGITSTTRGSCCWPPLIALREPPTLLDGIGKLGPDLSFGDGVLSITLR
jgi:hypothetical protein